MKKILLMSTAVLGTLSFASQALAANGLYYPKDDASANLGTVNWENKTNNSKWDDTILLVAGRTVTIGENSVLKNNNAGVGGAIAVATNAGSLVKIGQGTLLEGNSSLYDGGAIGNYGGAILAEGVTFRGNHAQTDVENDSLQIGGGAISLGSVSNTTIEGSVFENNDSKFDGGAIGTRKGYGKNDNSKGTFSVANSTFSGNQALGYSKGAGNGGAIANTFYNGVKVSNSSFEQNMAKAAGGAIYNEFDEDKSGKAAVMTLADNTFSGNIAGTTGGAIHNDAKGEINFTGTNTFSGNKDANGLNDIHNDGMLNVKGGTLSLEGGISGNGSLVFDAGSTLEVKTNVTKIANNVTTNGANLNLIFDNAFNGEYELVSGQVTDKDFTIAENNLYDITGVEGSLGTYKISAKSGSDVAAAIGANSNQAAAIAAMIGAKSENEAFNQTADKIATMLQSDATKAEGLKAVSAMSAEAAPIVRTVSTEHVNRVFGVVSSRLSNGTSLAPEGRSSGDMMANSALWVRGMINQSKLDGSFDTHTNGVAMGADKYINDDVKVGLGYAYARTDVESYSRDTEINAHTALLYAEYKPSAWFVNGVASYTWSKYEEDKSVAGTAAGAKFDTDTISLQAVTGYEVVKNNYIMTPTIGLRYVNIDRESYTDNLGTSVDSKNMDILTAMAGIKFGRNYTIDQFSLTPEVRAALTYDVMRDSDDALVSLANGGAYTVENTNLKRFGYEIGAGLTATLNDNVEFGVAYEGQFRKDYQDHTGLVSLKYYF